MDDSNVPHQEYCDKKYFRVVEAKVVSGGSTVTSQRTYVYRSGITFIERILKEYQGAKDDQGYENGKHRKQKIMAYRSMLWIET